MGNVDPRAYLAIGLPPPLEPPAVATRSPLDTVPAMTQGTSLQGAQTPYDFMSANWPTVSAPKSPPAAATHALAPVHPRTITQSEALQGNPGFYG